MNSAKVRSKEKDKPEGPSFFLETLGVCPADKKPQSDPCKLTPQDEMVLNKVTTPGGGQLC